MKQYQPGFPELSVIFSFEVWYEKISKLMQPLKANSDLRGKTLHVWHEERKYHCGASVTKEIKKMKKMKEINIKL